MGLLFAHPEWLSPLVAGWFALALAVLLAFARGRRRLRALVGAGTAAARRDRRPLRDAAPLLAVAMIAVGLLGPRAGERVIQLSTSGIDVVLLLDTSRSMDARDIPPSRIDAGREAASKLLDGLLSTDRAALAAFSGRGLLITPLTPDRDALQETLSAIDTALVRPGGSDIAAGIKSALRAFDRDDNRPRAIVVISDGEVEGGRGLASGGAVAATRSDAHVYAVAIGTEAGANVPDHGVPLRDADGQIVTSRRRTSTLAAIALETGGRLFAADEWGHVDTDALISELRRPVAAVSGGFVPHKVTVPVVLPFAAVAFVLLLGEWLPLGSRSGRRESRAARRASAGSAAARSERPAAPAVAAIAVLALLLIGADTPEPTADSASAPGDAGREAVNLLRGGVELAAEGEWERAEYAFLAAAVEAGSAETAARAFHNLGVAALEQDDLETAREAFFDALAARGRRTGSHQRLRTQWNLEWVLSRLAKESEQERLPEDLPPPPAPSQPQAPAPDPRADEPPDGEASDERDDRRAPSGSEPAANEPGDGTRDPEEDVDGRPPAQASAPTETSGTPAGEPTELDEAERKQWLARVTDDPRKAMLSAAFNGGSERTQRPRGAPTW